MVTGFSFRNVFIIDSFKKVMSVRIRLKKRFNLEGYDIIVTSNGQLKGRILDYIGFYSTEGVEKLLRINVSRLSYWLDKGGQCSERVLKMMKIYDESFREGKSGSAGTASR